jgi:hypothetical protein
LLYFVQYQFWVFRDIYRDKKVVGVFHALNPREVVAFIR